MSQYDEMGYNALADEVKSLQAKIKALKAEASSYQKELDEITIRVLPDKLAEDGFRSVNLANGGQIKLSPQAWCSTREGQKEHLFQWLDEHGFSELKSLTVNPSTLKAFIKEQLELGHEVPPNEIVNYEPYTRASVVGVK